MSTASTHIRTCPTNLMLSACNQGHQGDLLLLDFFPAFLIFLAFPMRFCLGPECWFTLMEERHKCSVCPNSPGRTLVVPRFVGCSNLQADLSLPMPLTRPQRKVAKCY